MTQSADQFSPAPFDLSTKSLVVEVDAFGDPKKVTASGFSDYITFSGGRWVQTPRTCAKGARLAERRAGNIRVIVNCAVAGSSASAWLRRVSIALARQTSSATMLIRR